MHDLSAAERQRAVCDRHSVAFAPPAAGSMLGYALAAKNDSGPLNGLRHRPEGGTSGWYVWRGETLSAADDFFQPIHVEHLVEEDPQVLDFLALPPGWRFLVDGDRVDVWFDATLLAI